MAAAIYALAKIQLGMPKLNRIRLVSFEKSNGGWLVLKTLLQIKMVRNVREHSFVYLRILKKM